MEQTNNPIYFAAKDAKSVSSVMLERAQEWLHNIQSNGYKDKLRDMYRAYHGAYYSASGFGHQVTFSGEQGELANIPINHFRNIATHMLNMTTANRPAMDARAVNTDVKSLKQAILANGILEYYMREKRLEKYLKNAVELAIVLGTGYIKMSWNSMSGDIYDVIENAEGKKSPIYDGDIEFTNLSPFDVVVDSTREHDDHDWMMVRGYKNKYDLAAKYPEFDFQIRQLQTKSEKENYKFGFNSGINETTDDVYVYEFYHKRTEALPDGRYILFLDNEIILHDRALPYRMIPIFSISPSKMLGTPLGYTIMFDVLPLNEAVNSLYSTVLTNQSAFGVQNVWVERGSDVQVEALHGGLNVISSLKRPEAINLTSTPPEIFKFIEMLERTMETISGVNSVARGSPESSLKSGVSLALVQSMALQFMSGLQQSYVALVEDVGSAIIKFLQDFANTPRIVAISGKSNRLDMKEFSGKDISNISRVVVDVGNPLSKTVAGRSEIAQNLIQYIGDKVSPEQYISVINTGKLEMMTDGVQHEQLCIRSENEALVDGDEPPVVFTDEHKEHIMQHKYVLASPELRKDAELVLRVTNHIQKHIELLRTIDPDTLMMLGQQPLQPPPPVGPPGTDATPNLPPPIQQGQTGPMPGAKKVQGPGIEQGVNLPGVPKVEANLLPNPELQQANLGNVNQP
jgi:hypothetical protein